MIIVNSTTSALVNSLILSNTAGNISVWIAPNATIWIAGKGNQSANPNLTGYSSPGSSLVNTCFVVSCDLSSATWYARSTSTSIRLSQGLLWDNTNTSVVLVGTGSGLGTPVTLNTNVGSNIISGGVVGSDILLQTSTSVTKFNSRGQRLWGITATSATLSGLTGHRVFGNVTNPSQAVLTTQTNLGITTTLLKVPQYWVADLDPSTGLPMIKSILFAPGLISGNDEHIVIVSQSAALQQTTGTADNSGNPIYTTIPISPSNSRNAIIRYTRQPNIPLTQTNYPSAFTISNILTDSSIACPQNTWLLQASNSTGSQEFVHIDCDGTVIWRATLSSAQAFALPLLHPDDNVFALLSTSFSPNATWVVQQQTIPIITSGLLLVNLHTGFVQSYIPSNNIPSNITSGAWVTPTLITVTTATTMVNFNLIGDRVTTTTTAATTPLIWPGGLSASVSNSYFNLVYRGKWVFQTDATNIITAIEANFADNSTIVFALFADASIYSYGSSLASLTDPDTLVSAGLILVALNSVTGAPLWMLPIDNAPQTVQITATATSLYLLATQSTATFTVGTSRYSDSNTLISLNAVTGSINWYFNDKHMQNIAFSGGLRTPITNLLVCNSSGLLVFTPPLPSILTAQLAVDQDPTPAGAQFISQGSRNLVIATTASNQFMQFGQAGCSKAAFAVSPSQLELNAPLNANQKLNVMGGGLEAAPFAKITAASPLTYPAFSVNREADPAIMTICAVSSNYYIQIGTNSFPSLTPLISNTGTNLLAVISRESNLSAVIDFGSSIPLSAKLLEVSQDILVIAVDVQIASPLNTPVFYDSRGIQCSVSANTPAFASSLYMTYLIQYAIGSFRLTPTRRLLQIEGSSRTLCLRADPLGNYVFSGTIATASSVSSLYITDTTANTVAISKASNASYYCKVSANGTFTILKTMTPLIADLALDTVGQNVYVLGNTTLTQYDNSGNPTVLATYSDVASAFWVSQLYSSTPVVLLGNSVGTLTAGSFTAISNVASGTPLSVLTSNDPSIAIVVTSAMLYAFSTSIPALPQIWALSISNITTACFNSDTLSVAFAANTNAIPQLTTFDGASITAVASGLTSAALYRITNLPIIEHSCTITAQPANGVWVAAGMPGVPINLGWAADVSQSTLAALSLTRTATSLNVPLSLASDTVSSGVISLATPLTVLLANTTYSLPAASTPGQLKVLVAASTASVSVGGGNTITVSGTTGVQLVYANSMWYQI